MYKVRNDLNMTKIKELESLFIKNSHKPENVLLGCIYQHSCVNLTKFNDLYLQPLDTLAF